MTDAELEVIETLLPRHTELQTLENLAATTTTNTSTTTTTATAITDKHFGHEHDEECGRRRQQQVKKAETTCGFWILQGVHLDRFANHKWYTLLYGLAGCYQSATSAYFNGTITSMEKEFGISTRNAGIISIGNNISQIIIVTFLSYYAGRGHRPRWIAVGLLTIVVYCLLTAATHFLYGNAIAFAQTDVNDEMSLTNITMRDQFERSNLLCQMQQQSTDDDGVGGDGAGDSDRLKQQQQGHCEMTEANLMPQAILFVAQFISGIGVALYYTLGIAYMDDNTNRTQTPTHLSISFFLNLLGPSLGYALVSFCLQFSHANWQWRPAIDRGQTSWIGAWWLGWLPLAGVGVLFSILFSMFPRTLPIISSASSSLPPSSSPVSPVSPASPSPPPSGRKNSNQTANVNSNTTTTTTTSASATTQANSNPYTNVNANASIVSTTSETAAATATAVAASSSSSSSLALSTLMAQRNKRASYTDLLQTLKRLCTNKILMSNNISSVFYFFGYTPFWVFTPKYLEIQFRQTASSSSMATGSVAFICTAAGILLSGLVLTKWKPSARYMAGWNVLVGILSVAGIVAYAFIACTANERAVETTLSTMHVMPSTPHNWQSGNNNNNNSSTSSSISNSHFLAVSNGIGSSSGKSGMPPSAQACNANCNCEHMPYTPVCGADGRTYVTPCHAGCKAQKSLNGNGKQTFYDCACIQRRDDIDNNNNNKTSTAISSYYTSSKQGITNTTTTSSSTTTSTAENPSTATQRDANTNLNHLQQTSPMSAAFGRGGEVGGGGGSYAVLGACPADCLTQFYAYLTVMCAVKFVGAAGRTSNLIISMRCVDERDKTASLGFGMMIISLFTFIPSPILFGWLFDRYCVLAGGSTAAATCSSSTNCWLYDVVGLRYALNWTAAAFVSIGTLFDCGVWYYSKDLQVFDDSRRHSSTAAAPMALATSDEIQMRVQQRQSTDD